LGTSKTPPEPVGSRFEIVQLKMHVAQHLSGSVAPEAVIGFGYEPIVPQMRIVFNA
jgi:hypothetical protein